MKVMSYTFMTMAGLCFISGLFVLTSEGEIDHGTFGNVVRHD